MTLTTPFAKRFPLGRIVITLDAQAELHPYDVRLALYRHSLGDWGDLCGPNAAENESALKEGRRLFSVYRDRHQVQFYIMTQADRSLTEVMLPEDL